MCAALADLVDQSRLYKTGRLATLILLLRGQPAVLSLSGVKRVQRTLHEFVDELGQAGAEVDIMYTNSNTSAMMSQMVHEVHELAELCVAAAGGLHAHLVANYKQLGSVGTVYGQFMAVRKRPLFDRLTELERLLSVEPSNLEGAWSTNRPG
jgi:hypothetical protein